MSEYTPTTDEMRAFYTAERLDGPHLDGFPPPTVKHAEAEFDRWLAAHDAEVRQEGDYHEGFKEGVKVGRAEAGSVVAEEPEWEYGVGWNYVNAPVPMGTRYPSRESAEDAIRQYPQDQDFGPNYLVRRRPEQPAGPWIPVEAG